MINIFQHLESIKGKKIPLLFKLKNNMPLTDDDLTVNDNVNLFRSKITWLPDNLTVHGGLDLTRSKIKILPKYLTVNGCLCMNYTDIEDLPDFLIVEGNLSCWYTPLAEKISNDSSLLDVHKKQVKGTIFYK